MEDFKVIFKDKEITIQAMSFGQAELIAAKNENTDDIIRIEKGANKSRGLLKKFKTPIEISIIPSVYEAMIDYRNEHSENQQRQLAVSCEVILNILMNCIKE